VQRNNKNNYGGKMPDGKDLIAVFASISDREQMAQFFEEIFSRKEIKDLMLRWQLLCDLYSGQTQRGIAAKYGISLCKITRGAKILKQEGSMVHSILHTAYGGTHEQ
jgi:TrpR family trp operon transcriptional repressor